MSRILIIDDQPAIAQALDVLLTLQGWQTEAVTTPAAGLQRLRRGGIDVVVQDMNFSADTTSGDEGVTLFHALRQIDADVPIIVITAWTHLETAVALVKVGAADYLAKPWDDQKLIASLRNLLELRQLQRAQSLQVQQKQKQRQWRDTVKLADLCYDSEAMHAVVQLAVKVAASDLPVLITGESGVGKEKIAAIIEANSRRSGQAFIKVNCGALPSELIEAELFGAEAGAYTGANKARIGRFEAADGGTLFLDEIGNLSLSGQMKLLRVLQTGEFEKLGSSKTQRVDVRVISATNSQLADAVSGGQFRDDLYYRLNVIELAVPALRDRADDIVLLAQHFLPSNKTLNSDAEEALMNHSWPGNVRELENCMARAVLMANSDVITAFDLRLPSVVAERSERPVSPEITLTQIEQALQQCNGVIAQAARVLGLSRQALYRRMQSLGLRGDL